MEFQTVETLFKNVFSDYLINEGNAQDNGIGRRYLDYDKELCIEDDAIYDMVYINANGQILSNCDMSYETQEDFIIGDIQNIKQLPEKGDSNENN
jgi:hypothetical protein